ncbi:hypothetical protein AB0O87_14805 [Microbacterium sp. NPDC076768]|uniref:hypothetical protein n=1 Tax=Microbacterium TaxID=33882 RepID=UPI001F48FF80|nr:hypothetical protein [Microbacterium profundi]MCE7483318.1 hypothetical protein [Microbacterium profundi]
MSTLDLLDDSFPHGTPNGYRRGCRTAACPALIPCRTVHTRYVGDFSFARLFDAGTPLTEILERDAAARDEARQSDKNAARKERDAAAMAARPRRAKPTPTPRAKRAAAPKPARQPHPAQDSHPRPSTPAAPRTRTHAGYQWIDKARAAAAQLPVDLAGTFTQAVDRYEAELDRHVDELAQGRDEQRDLRDRLRAATETLKTATIAAGSGLSVGGVIERALHNATVQHQAATDALAAHARPTPPAKPRMPRPRGETPRRTPQPRQLQPHGTNACRARGCDRPECIEAGREYHRQWMANRKAQAIPLEHHGTAYGYQLGCKDRDHCPAETSCADASLAEERRRRREAGIAPQAPRVPAEPVRQHVRQLMASGMTVIEIADSAQASKSGVKILLYGRSGARKGELPREIEAEKAQRLLALQPATAAPELARSA